MKILIISDEECPAFWEYYVPGRLKEYDLIISCGDLKSKYLSFVVTMARCPVLYVHGNHDTHYVSDPPFGCDCIDGHIVTYNGLRILGLGGCRKYNSTAHQYTDQQMRRRIRKLRWKLKRLGGVDIVVTHCPPEGLGDAEDRAHRGFAAFRELLDQYHPRYFFHGHVHMNYGMQQPRVREYEGTTLINASDRYVLDLPEVPHEAKDHNQVRYITKYKDPYPDDIANGFR